MIRVFKPGKILSSNNTYVTLLSYWCRGEWIVYLESSGPKGFYVIPTETLATMRYYSKRRDKDTQELLWLAASKIIPVVERKFRNEDVGDISNPMKDDPGVLGKAVMYFELE